MKFLLSSIQMIWIHWYMSANQPQRCVHIWSIFSFFLRHVKAVQTRPLTNNRNTKLELHFNWEKSNLDILCYFYALYSFIHCILSAMDIELGSVLSRALTHTHQPPSLCINIFDAHRSWIAFQIYSVTQCSSQTIVFWLHGFFSVSRIRQ